MNGSHKFQILVDVTAEAYVRERDQLLSETATLPGLVQSHLTAADWRVRIQALILAGWRTNPAQFRKFYAALDGIKVAEEQTKMGGMAAFLNLFAERAEEEYKEQGLPIWWEIILKFGAAWPDWKVVATIRCLEEVPDQRSLDPLIWIMKHTESMEILDAAAMTLPKLPKKKEETRKEVENLIRVFERKLDSAQEALEEMEED